MTMHHVPCPVCSTGSKLVTFITTAAGMQGLVLTKYSSCSCPLSESDRQRLIRLARAEAAVI